LNNILAGFGVSYAIAEVTTNLDLLSNLFLEINIIFSRLPFSFALLKVQLFRVLCQ